MYFPVPPKDPKPAPRTVHLSLGGSQRFDEVVRAVIYEQHITFCTEPALRLRVPRGEVLERGWISLCYVEPDRCLPEDVAYREFWPKLNTLNRYRPKLEYLVRQGPFRKFGQLDPWRCQVFALRLECKISPYINELRWDARSACQEGWIDRPELAKPLNSLVFYRMLESEDSQERNRRTHDYFIFQYVNAYRKKSCHTTVSTILGEYGMVYDLIPIIVSYALETFEFIPSNDALSMINKQGKKSERGQARYSRYVQKMFQIGQKYHKLDWEDALISFEI